MKPLSFLSTSIILSVAATSSAMAYDAGDIIVRAGVTTVSPQESIDPIALDGTTLSLGGGTSKLELDSDTQLGLTATYMYDSNWGIELLAATPFQHTASATGELVGVGSVVETKHLPPTLSAVYYFNTAGSFNPYFGAGINYTVFFDEDVSAGADTAFSDLGLTGADASINDSWGLAIQLGADYQLNDRWLVNASVRWIDINTEATINFDNGSKITTDIEVDPFVYTLAIGYKF
jgi:outer membrane protein